MDDREFLLDSRQWPSFELVGHYCCLKKSKPKGCEHAFILIADNTQGMNGKVVVSLGDVFSGGTGETVALDSIDALLAEGWMVD